MKDIFRYDETNEETAVFGVIADPVGHSLSPIVHNAAFEHDQLNSVYVPFRIPVEYLDVFMEDCPTLGLKGLSVTIPHKEAIVKHCTQLDRATQLVGAANTVVFKDGAVLGYNTDYRAAMSSLERVLKKPLGETPLSGHVALLLGAGGVARALAFGLKKRGAAVVIASRTRDKANVLAKLVDGRAVDWGQRHSIKADILINATPIGMHPNVDSEPYDMHYVRPGSIVFESVYNPEQTLLVKEAKKRGCRIISGVEMFIGQAALQYKLFTGRDAPQDVMRAHFKRAIGPAKS
jgi:3-dehydroquinate dehydratase/shikimate dehydrogenase